MKINHVILVFFVLVCEGLFAQSAPMTPGQAVDVLKTSTDIEELAKAVKVATANPSTRPAVIAFFDGPAREKQLANLWLKKNAGLTDEVIQNQALLREWAAAHQVEARKLNDQWYALEGTTGVDVISFFAQSSDPTTFEVFTHLATSKQFDLWGGSLSVFAQSMPLNSPMEPLLLNLTMQTSPYALRTVCLIKSTAALALAEKIIRSENDSNVEFNNEIGVTLGDLMSMRYDARVLRLFQLALDRNSEKLDLSLVYTLFVTRLDSETPPVPGVESVNPLVYPALLKFIYDAQKLNLPEGRSEMLADAKTKLLALYAKHNLTPPTDAELAAMKVEAPTLPVTPPAATAPKATPKPQPALAESPLSGSMPLFIAAGLAVVIGAFIFVRRK